jgi:hypothetical protein
VYLFPTIIDQFVFGTYSMNRNFRKNEEEKGEKKEKEKRNDNHED